MSKLTYEDKINIYYLKKQGISRKCVATTYKIKQQNVQYLVRIIDRHGFEVLRTTSNKMVQYI